MAILSTLESTSLDETIRCASKWFILRQLQNLELLNLKCVTYTQPIPLPLTILTNHWLHYGTGFCK